MDHFQVMKLALPLCLWLVAACATTVAPELGVNHPANVTAAEAPRPVSSRALKSYWSPENTKTDEDHGAHEADKTVDHGERGNPKKDTHDDHKH